MSRSASVALDFADGSHVFRLAWGQLIELQERCEAGPYVIADRLRTRLRAVGEGTEEEDPPLFLPPLCSPNEISQVIRLGLIGGGMEPVKALHLVRTYVEARAPEENRVLAYAILQTALYGAPEEKVGEAEAANPVESELTASPTES